MAAILTEAVKTEYAQLTAAEVLQSSPVVLLGVPPASARVLQQLGIESVFDLASSRVFANATALLTAGNDVTSVMARHGKAPSDVVDAAAGPVAVDELRFQPVAVLAGV